MAASLDGEHVNHAMQVPVLSQRVSALEIGLKDLSTQVRDQTAQLSGQISEQGRQFSATVESLGGKLEHAITGINRDISKSEKTDWKLIAAFLTVFGMLGGAFVAMTKAPIESRLDHIEREAGNYAPRENADLKNKILQLQIDQMRAELERRHDKDAAK